MSNVVTFPKKYDFLIEGEENGQWVSRVHHGSIDSIPRGMCWKARYVRDKNKPVRNHIPTGTTAA